MFVLKVTFVCLCLSVTAIVVAKDPPLSTEVPQPRLLTKAENMECILESKISPGEISRIEMGFSLTSKSQFCMVSCIWRKANVITETGQFLPENAIAFNRLQVGFSLTDNPKSMKDSIYKCLKEVAGLTAPGECMLGGLMYSCLMNVEPQACPKCNAINN